MALKKETHLPWITVEVAYADSSQQVVVSLQVEMTCTALQAIEASCIRQQFPEIKNLEKRIGIFGKSVSVDTQLQNGDRVEIYRDLYQDPKEIRRKKAALKLAQRATSVKR